MSNKWSNFKGREKTALWAGLSLVAALCFMLFLYAPSELYFYNQREFWFDVYTLLPLMLVLFVISFGALSAVMLFFFTLCPKFYHKVVLPIGCILFLCTYIQGNFLIGDLPPMDGTEYDWADYSEGRIYTIILWVVVSAIVLFIFKKVSKDKFCRGIKALSIFMMLMLSVTAVSICISTQGYAKKTDAYTTYKNDFEFSQDQNFIIFLIDAADSGTMYEMLEANSEYKKIFEDFTYYRNTTGAYPATLYAVPQILSGEWYENEADFDGFCIDAFNHSPLFSSLEQSGYKMGLYEDILPLEDANIFRFDNIVSRKSEVSSYLTLAKLEIKLVGLRYAPFDLKRFCSFKLVEFAVTRESDYEYPIFILNNKIFYDRVKSEEISYTPEKCFKFVHIEGAHVPFQYDKDVNLIENGTYEDVMAASLTITEAYLNKIKEAGVYDNSVIVVMADHGFDVQGWLDCTGRQNPILFVKGINEHHEMVCSEAPVSFDDLQDIYAQLLEGKSSREALTYQEGDIRERRYLFYVYGRDENLYEYVTTGHASEDDSLRETGKVYPVED